MNKVFVDVITMVAMTIALLFSSVSFAAEKGEKGKSADGPLLTERFKTNHGVVVRNTYDGIRHTCINSNPHSRASSRSEVCTFELKVGGEWVVENLSTARDASIWRSLPAAVLNGTGAAAVQGVFAVRAAKELYCGAECGTTINNNNTANATNTNTNTNTATNNNAPVTSIGIENNIDVQIPCTTGGC